MLIFFIGPLNSFFNKKLFFKFINKCQTEILWCAPPSSHVCDFFNCYLAAPGSTLGHSPGDRLINPMSITLL